MKAWNRLLDQRHICIVWKVVMVQIKNNRLFVQSFASLYKRSRYMFSALNLEFQKNCLLLLCNILMIFLPRLKIYLKFAYFELLSANTVSQNQSYHWNRNNYIFLIRTSKNLRDSIFLSIESFQSHFLWYILTCSWRKLLLTLTYFSPLFYFYTPWKHQKTFGFLTFSGVIEMEHWAKMD